MPHISRDAQNGAFRKKGSFSENAMGGVEKRGGWKTSRMTPLPKRGFGPPLVRYVFHPPHVSVLCFSCTTIHDRGDQKLFWRGPKIFGRARSLVRFPPPIRFAPPHITAQLLEKGSFQKVHFLESMENLEILENTQTVENKGESDHFL